MGPLAVINSSAMCGLHERTFWKPPFEAALPSTFCMPYADQMAKKGDLICRIKEVAANIGSTSTQLPAGTLMTYAGVTMILVAASIAGLNAYLATAIPDFVFNRKGQ